MKYVHIRKRLPNGQVATHGGITAIFDTTKLDGNNVLVEGCYAFCCDRDNYNRKLGRKIVDARFKACDPHHAFLFSASASQNIVAAVVEKVQQIRNEWQASRVV